MNEKNEVTTEVKEEKKYKYALKKKKFILSEESAIEQVMLLLEYYEIEVEEDSQTEVITDKLVEYIRQGYVEIKHDEKLEVIQNIQRRSKNGTVSQLIYKPLTGRNHKAMDGKNDNEKRAAMFALLGSMCDASGGLPAINQLETIDINVAVVLGTLFLS